MKNKMKFISFIITLIVVFTSIPLNALAEDETDLFFTPGVGPAFPTKPPLRHKVDKKLTFYPR